MGKGLSEWQYVGTTANTWLTDSHSHTWISEVWDLRYCVQSSERRRWRSCGTTKSANSHSGCSSRSISETVESVAEQIGRKMMKIMLSRERHLPVPSFRCLQAFLLVMSSCQLLVFGTKQSGTSGWSGRESSVWLMLKVHGLMPYAKILRKTSIMQHVLGQLEDHCCFVKESLKSSVCKHDAEHDRLWSKIYSSNNCLENLFVCMAYISPETSSLHGSRKDMGMGSLPLFEKMYSEMSQQGKVLLAGINARTGLLQVGKAADQEPYS